MKSGWMKGTLILTITAFFVKLLSLVYKVPYQNLSGDEGLYVFQQVYPLIGIYTILNGVVLPTIISELLLTYQYSEDIKRYIKNSLWIFSLVGFASLFIGSDFIAYAMGDVQLKVLIQIVGIAFLLIPPVSYWRGVAQTRPETIATVGYSSTIEQLFRVIAIIAALFMIQGQNIYKLAYFAYLGGLCGPLLAIAYLMLKKLDDSPKIYLKMTHRPHFFKKCVYLFLSAGILIIFQLIDSFFVFNSLVNSGVPALEAMSLKGAFDRGLPIIQTATVFTSAIISSTVPQIAGVTEQKERKKVFNTSLFMVIALSIPACLGLFSVVDELNIALFKDSNGIEALKLLTLQVLFYPFVFLCTAILQQEEQYSKLLVSVLGGVLVKVALTAPLTESLGISGTAIASVASLAMMTLINLCQFRKMIYSKSFFNLLKVSFATLGIWMVLDFLEPQIPTILVGVTDIRFYNIISLAIQVGAGILVYGVIMGIFLMTSQVTAKGARRKKKAKNKKQPAAKKKPIES
ncbi:MAG: oligosaccharide flippase family protein [Turicibacter sp.]|nr:oligosaccharide flippase family protein [Turicibacter sp.]